MVDLVISTTTGEQAVSSVTITMKWSTRNDATGYYLIEEMAGMAKVEFGPMTAAYTNSVLSERRAWFELQVARLRCTASDLQAYCQRRSYPR